MAAAMIALSDAEKIAQEFKDFTYIVSHDLGTPLRGMVEFSRLLKSEQSNALNAEGKEYLTLIIESGEKLQNMVLSLIDYSRLSTNTQFLNEIDCCDLLQDCRANLQHKIEQLNATLEISTMPVIFADEEQIKQLFFVLLDNALKFVPENTMPHISVTAEIKEASWLFTIKDNGIGIGQEFHKRVFQPFQRLHNDSVYPGIGMGLALAKKIVDRHNGEISLVSNSGQGTSVIFTIPQPRTK